MEVKEAVRKINEVYDEWILEYAGSEKTSDEMTNECEEIISLLQDLEKYKEIVNSIQWHIQTSKECSPEVYGWLKFIERIIEKYFPQPVKKVITDLENFEWCPYRSTDLL